MTESRLTRRRFIRDIGITCACTNVFAKVISPPGPALAQNERGTGSRGVPSMEYRTLGRTGLEVSAVSFGVMRLTDPSVLYKALEEGINYFDTAHKYQNGNNERMLGKVLKDHRRDKVFIATKISPYLKGKDSLELQSIEAMESMMNTSLARLQTEYVDMLFLHAIRDPDTPLNEDMLDFMQRQKKAGRTRFLGISFHVDGSLFVDIAKQALKSDLYDAFLASCNFKSPEEHVSVLRLARNNNVGIIAMKTQAGGYKVGATGNVTPQQAALRWALNQDFVDCAVPGMVNMEQLTENVRAIGVRLSHKDKRALYSYYSAIKNRYCVSCGFCTGQCERDIDIPTINRSLMYLEGYNDFELARNTYRELHDGENASACKHCHKPTCKCANGIALNERMSYAHRVFA
jgi:predicted aldo/keto reductase-like oxidoreductase